MIFMMELLVFIVIGIVAGLSAGLLGIGGGIITTPCLFLVFRHLGFPVGDMMHLAIGTSLAAMVFNTLSASYSHYKRKAVLFSIVRPMVIGVVLGGACGAFLAKVLSGTFLQIFFGSFELLIGLRFVLPEFKIKKTRSIPSFLGLSAISLGISTISTMIGMGGGTINVPVLTYYNVSMKKAIGTASALSFSIALVGAVFFLLFGKAAHEPETFGFIYVPAFVVISIAAFFAAPWGVRLAHYLPTRILRRIFGIVLIGVGAGMVLAAL